MNPATTRRRERLFAIFFAASAAIVWLPFKAPPYLLPIGVTALYALTTRSRSILKRLVQIAAAYMVLTLIWSVVQPDFYWKGAFLTFLSFGGLIFLAVIGNTGVVVSESTLQRIAGWWTRIVLLEGIVGISEAMYGFLQSHSLDINNGDWVKGTIGLGAHGLIQGMNFSNAIFAVNLAFGLIFVSLSRRDRILRNAAFVVGGVALVLASVVHVILFALAAVGFTALALHVRTRRWMKAAAALAGLCGAVLLLAVVVLPKNLGELRPAATQVARLSTPKGVVLARVFGEMIPHRPYVAFVGAGPGQFNSTGALIATGEYFGGPIEPRSIPFLPRHLTHIQREYFYDQWVRQAQSRYFGSTQAPYFSLLSIFVEFGAFVAIGAVVLLLSPVLTARRCFRRQPRTFLMCAALAASSILMVLLGMQVNYWGVPQATWLGFLNIVVLRSYCTARMSAAQDRANDLKPGMQRLARNSADA